MYKILVATDGSAHSLWAARHAAKVGKAMEAEITVLSVIPKAPNIKGHEGLAIESIATFERNIEEGMRRAAQEALDKTAIVFAELGMKANTRIEKGSPDEVICKIAETEGFDEIVMGSRGYGGIKGMLLGSVTNKVIHRSSVTTTIVK